MNRLSINAKKDEKSPFPLENNELGMNFNYLTIWGRYRVGPKFEYILIRIKIAILKMAKNFMIFGSAHDLEKGHLKVI